MKVILSQNIPKVGKKHDVVDVADGYALNSLIPGGKAIPGTPAAIRQVEVLRAKEAEKRAAADAALSGELAKADGAAVSIERPANDKGHLFAAVHENDIADAIKAKTGLSISADHVKISQPIKEVGVHKVKIEVSGKKADIEVSVVSAGASA